MSKPEIYSELYFILQQVPYSYMKTLPPDTMAKLEQDMSLEHYNSFRKDQIFYKQNFDKESINILEKICQKYWNEE